MSTGRKCRAGGKCRGEVMSWEVESRSRFRVRKDGIGAFFYLGHTAKKATREHVLLPHARQLSVKIVHGNISQRTLVYLIIVQY